MGEVEEWGDPSDREENSYSLLLNDSSNRLKQRSNKFIRRVIGPKAKQVNEAK